MENVYSFDYMEYFSDREKIYREFLEEEARKEQEVNQDEEIKHDRRDCSSKQVF